MVDHQNDLKAVCSLGLDRVVSLSAANQGTKKQDLIISSLLDASIMLKKEVDEIKGICSAGDHLFLLTEKEELMRLVGDSIVPASIASSNFKDLQMAKLGVA